MIIATYQQPKVVVRDHSFDAPINYDAPAEGSLRIFARELRHAQHAHEHRPTLVYLQGGPGFESPRPTGLGGWLNEALKRYHVVLLDQRGTGRSTPVTAYTLASRQTPREQATYLSHFRADAIVRDAELVRRELLGADERWTVLGQSFGGFCALHYLCAAPHGLAQVMFTGGLPPLDAHPDEVYRATYKRCLERNKRYFKRYPQDQEQARAIVTHLEARGGVVLPAGGTLSARRFQQLGILLGASDGAESLHYVLDAPFVDGPDGPQLSYRFLRGVEAKLPFDTNPLYALMHEAIYCQGEASRWSAHRIREEFPAFDLGPEQPVYFTGEMVYPWMFEDYAKLAPFREAAELLAAKEDWAKLYDKALLSENQVPCAALIYDEDMYVERTLSSATANAVSGMRVWVTNELEHNGLRAEGRRVLQGLHQLLPSPSDGIRAAD